MMRFFGLAAYVGTDDMTTAVSSIGEKENISAIVRIFVSLQVKSRSLLQWETLKKIRSISGKCSQQKFQN